MFFFFVNLRLRWILLSSHLFGHVFLSLATQFSLRPMCTSSIHASFTICFWFTFIAIMFNLLHFKQQQRKKNCDRIFLISDRSTTEKIGIAKNKYTYVWFFLSFSWCCCCCCCFWVLSICCKNRVSMKTISRRRQINTTTLTMFFVLFRLISTLFACYLHSIRFSDVSHWNVTANNNNNINGNGNEGKKKSKPKTQ